MTHSFILSFNFTIFYLIHVLNITGWWQWHHHTASTAITRCLC